MATIDLTNLEPGKTYTVMVRAKDDSGLYGPNSAMYTFTTPYANLDGTQLTSTNSTVVTALAKSSSSVIGGALTAGGLDLAGTRYSGKAQLSELWNDTASAISSLTGTASTGAVIINSTGILGYKFSTTSSGQAQFFLNTADGNAYFRGTLYAGAGQIGGWTIGATSLTNLNVGMVAPATYATGELVTNGSFETGNPTGWVVFGANVNVSTINPYSGSWNLSIRQDGICGASSTNYISVIPGNSYQLSAYMMTSRTPILGDLFVYWYNSASTLISTSSGSNSITSSYARYILNATSPANAAYAKIQVSNEVGSIGTFSVDLISFSGTIVPASSEISFYSGSAFANRALAPFRVDYAGNLVATNASITGNINATSGSFTGAVIIGSSSGIFDIKIGLIANQNVPLPIASGSAIGYSPYGLSGIYGNSSFYLMPAYFGFSKPGFTAAMSLYNTKTASAASGSLIPFAEEGGAIALSSVINTASTLYTAGITSDYYSAGFGGTGLLGSTYLYQSASDTWTAGPKLSASNIPYMTSAGSNVFATTLAGTTAVAFAVTFPTGKFSTIPVFNATVYANGVAYLTSTVRSVTASGATGAIYNIGGGTASNVTLLWTATQMTSTSGTG